MKICATISALLLGLCVSVTAQPRVVSEHPRLFLRASDIPALKERCRTLAPVKEPYEVVRRFAYNNAQSPNLWVAPDELSSVLLAWLVEDSDPKLLARARGYLDHFSRAEGDSWTRPRMLKAIAQAYDWLHDALNDAERSRLASRMSELVAEMRKQYRHSDYNNHVYLEYGPIVYAGLALAGDGIADDFARKALSESEALLKEHFIPTVNQLSGGRQGGWHESMSYWSFFAYELAHQLEAWRTATGEDLFTACQGLAGAANWLAYCTRPHDGSMAPIGDIITPTRWSWQEAAYLPLVASRHNYGLAQQLALQVRPDPPSRAWPFVLWFDPRIKPIQLNTLPLGTLFPGIGWASMRSSWEKNSVWALFVCGDYYAGHQHSDQNSFVIARRGELAIDAGEYGAKEAAFHNTVLIGEGQRVYGNDPRQNVAPTPTGSEFDTGDIIAFEENEFFTHTVGDASNAFGKFLKGRRTEPAPRFLRRFIFLKPSTFVIDDEIHAPISMGAVRWLLHSRQTPEISGRQIRIADGDGELVCETLLPAEAGQTSAPQTGGRRQRTDYRIEVTPSSRSSDVRFLHVLHTRDRGDANSQAHSELADRNGTLSLTVATRERVFRLSLPPTSVGAGAIEVSRASGGVVLNRRPLPSGVLPYGVEGPRLLERWDSAYRSGGQAPWDTGRPSSELKKAVEDGTLPRGRVLELGCGTGNSAIYLATHGFEVSAIDIAPTALRLAEDKAAKAGVQVRWVLADVLAPPKLEPFDVIFDRGCYHGVRRQNAAEYVETLRRFAHPGTRVLILAGNANERTQSGPPRVKEEELRADFSRWFDFERLREIRFDTADGAAQGALAWSVLLRRKADR